ncbi:hypothetical protein [Nocardioides cynanchi]|uniref:hypothetical protein n=1 Tax=Nocardioides cynanchi TaxID=2558918 RepID=UPI001248D6A3|nr:hypothetical protein [Nocardioides cynanchi]
MTTFLGALHLGTVLSASLGPAGPVAGSGGQQATQGWLDPAVPWPMVAAAILSLTFLSAAASMHAWSGTRKHHEITSIGRRAPH